MKTMFKTTAFTALAGLALMTATVMTPGAAQAENILASVRVLPPGGQYINVSNTPDMPWYRRPEFTRYNYSRYSYDPARRAYVVYTPQRDHWKGRDAHWNRGNPGQHGNGGHGGWNH